METLAPWLDDGDVRLYHGDALEVLRSLPDESVDCVVTSPPYWGLRDYGTGEWAGGDPDCDHRVRQDARIESSTLGGGKATTGHQREGFKERCGRCGATRVDRQMGLEPTPDLFVAGMVELFREIRRVLAPHGTCWVNLGDSYNANQGAGFNGQKRQDHANRHTVMPNSGVKPKDLVGIPWRVAFALQADGWYLRADVIWAKPNPMPESVTDRPTKSHEYVFLLTKRPRYWFDQEAVREDFEARPQQRLTTTREQPLAAARRAAGVEQGNPQGGTHVSRFAVQSETLAGDCGCHDAGCGRTFHASDCGCACHNGSPRGPDGRRVTAVRAGEHSLQHRDGERWPGTGRNVRSVWQIATQPYPEAHFATFPEELARRCIVAGCPIRVCRVCGKPSERIVETVGHDKQRWAPGEDQYHTQAKGKHGSTSSFTTGLVQVKDTLGWSDCGHNNWRPGVTLDPFIGSGTVAKVARDHQRHAIGIDLNETYLELAARRLQQLSLLTGDAA